MEIVKEHSSNSVLSLAAGVFTLLSHLPTDHLFFNLPRSAPIEGKQHKQPVKFGSHLRKLLRVTRIVLRAAANNKVFDFMLSWERRI